MVGTILCAWILTLDQGRTVIDGDCGGGSDCCRVGDPTPSKQTSNGHCGCSPRVWECQGQSEEEARKGQRGRAGSYFVDAQADSAEWIWKRKREQWS